MRCFKACGLSNEPIENVLDLTDTDSVDEVAIKLSTVAKIEYDPKASEYEKKYLNVTKICTKIGKSTSKF